MDDRIIPFGKHKGKPVEVLASDKEYQDWLLAQTWFKEKYTPIYNIVIQNFREPSDTPEHNKIQIKFLQLEYQLRLAYFVNRDLFKYNSERINKKMLSLLDSTEIAEYYPKGREGYSEGENFLYGLGKVSESPASKMYSQQLLKFSNPIFERVDVQYSIFTGLCLNQSGYCDTRILSENFFAEGRLNTFTIEIKPTISEDFPAILRQMKASMPVEKSYYGERRHYILLVGTYTGQSATKEEFVEYFRTQGYIVVFENEINNLVLPKYELEFKLDSEIKKRIDNEIRQNLIE